MTRALLAFALVTLAGVRSASAQASAPPVPGSITIPFVPPTTASDSAPPPPDALSLPMRLSFLSSVVPVSHALTDGGCGAKSVAAAGTIFPTQLYSEIRLLPRLVLHGFSDVGCPGDGERALDAGAGAGLTYATPLRANMWLVGSLGAYDIPGHDRIPQRRMQAGGLDLVVKKRDAGTVSAGVGVVTKQGETRVMVRTGGRF